TRATRERWRSGTAHGAVARRAERRRGHRRRSAGWCGMRAVIPDGCGSVAMTDVPEPVVGQDEVLLAVQADSVNPGQTVPLDAPRPGWRPGKDVAGRVVDVGADVTAFTVGRRVVAHPEHSGWAELVTVPADRVAGLPDTIASATAAALPLAGLTALRLVRAIG